MKYKKILFVIDVMNHGGGAQKVLPILLNVLRDFGISVSLAVLKKTQNMAVVENSIECELPNLNMASSAKNGGTNDINGTGGANDANIESGIESDIKSNTNIKSSIESDINIESSADSISDSIKTDLAKIKNPIKIYYILPNEALTFSSNIFPILGHLSDICEASKINLVVSFMDFATSYFVSLAANCANLPYFICSRAESSKMSEIFSSPSTNIALYALALRGAKLVVCNSLASCADMRENFGVKKSKLRLLRNPLLDFDKFKLKNNLDSIKSKSQIAQNSQITAICVGRLSKQKNYPTILKALAKMQNIRLLICGDGEERESLENLAKELKITQITPNLSETNFAQYATNQSGADSMAAPQNSQESAPQVAFLGNVKEVSVFLKKAQIFIHAASFEGFPNAVLEAAAHALPLVLSDIAVHREIFKEGKNAVFFDTFNEESLCAAFEALRANLALQKLQSKQNLKIAQKHDLAHFKKAAKKIFL